MKSVLSDVVQFRGSHYDFCFMQGELLKDSPTLTNRKRMWGSKTKLRHFIVDENEVKKMILHFAPAFGMN